MYIGATRSVDWHEATLFSALFYSAYLKRKGRGLDRLVRGEAAAVNAIGDYRVVTGSVCPFKCSACSPVGRGGNRSGDTSTGLPQAEQIPELVDSPDAGWRTQHV